MVPGHKYINAAVPAQWSKERSLFCPVNIQEPPAPTPDNLLVNHLLILQLPILMEGTGERRQRKAEGKKRQKKKKEKRKKERKEKNAHTVKKQVC